MSDWRRHDPLVLGVPRSAFRPSGIFLAIVAVFALSGLMAWHQVTPRLAVFVFVISGWLVSLCLHEYAHALVAYRSGDTDVAHRGYLTLNPLKYSNVLLSIILPLVVVVLGGIGLPGGAVWVDHAAIRGRLRKSLISLAGPATNLLFTLVLLIPFAFDPDVWAHLEFWAGVGLLAFLQLTATVLNLLPVPGLDGGNALQPWLKPNTRRMYDVLAPYGFILLFVLLWEPTINRIFFNAVFAVGDVLGLDRYLYALGFDLLRFWQPA
ncbi:site-2 protease family protein [Asanoa sp. WMMD1127]|uniref:site-2 protease family protein n=1 Tax=Asanoa sp. WMMD1127 TaxID=3016107 RepID=UPI00241738ED|nr:site-2 protease family protein [Asanoa sp. WMMD1127]MDG4827200.1 site-2 protease family protein [Asanoa sp. WMMD1127]